MTEETLPTAAKPKLRRKRKSRGPVCLRVAGKIYRGTTIETTGPILTLIQPQGYVRVHMESGVVIEVAGVQAPTQTPMITGGPRVSGSGASAFNAGRNRSVEGLMTLPGDYDAS